MLFSRDLLSQVGLVYVLIEKDKAKNPHYDLRLTQRFHRQGEKPHSSSVVPFLPNTDENQLGDRD